MTYKAVLFDLDGTLLDTLEELKENGARFIIKRPQELLNLLEE